MFKSQIIQIFNGYDTDRVGASKNSEKELDEVIECRKAMLEKIGEDEQFKKLFDKFDCALNNLNYADIENVFRDGFILGARLALEICGAELD